MKNVNIFFLVFIKLYMFIAEYMLREEHDVIANYAIWYFFCLFAWQLDHGQF